MANFSALAPYLIAALLAVAMLIPGLDAVQKAIEGIIEDRKITSKEACLAIVERERGTAIYNTLQNNQKQLTCQAKLNAEVKEAYKPALFYICKTRQLVTLINENPNATSEAIETSAADPTLQEKCSQYEKASSAVATQ
jgi:hypothetical protein